MNNTNWKRNVFFVCVSVLCFSVAQNVTLPFLPIFMSKDLNVGENLALWSSITYSITFLVGALTAPFWGVVSDKSGRKRLVIMTGVGLAVIYALTSIVTGPMELLVCRVLAGLLAGYMTFSNALVSTNTPKDKSAYALSAVYTAGSVGFVLGPLVGGFSASYFGYRPTFLLASILCIIAVICMICWVKEEAFTKMKKKTGTVQNIKEALSNKSLRGVLVSLLMLQSSITLIAPLVPLLVVEMSKGIGENVSLWAGAIFSLYGLSAIIATPLWTKLGYRIGFDKCLVWGAVIGGIFNILQVFSTSLLIFACFRFMYGIFAASIIPAVNILITQKTDPELRGRAFGLNQSCSELGRFMGPNIGGLMAENTSLRSVFGLNGFLLLILPIILLPLFKVHNKKDP